MQFSQVFTVENSTSFRLILLLLRTIEQRFNSLNKYGMTSSKRENLTQFSIASARYWSELVWPPPFGTHNDQITSIMTPCLWRVNWSVRSSQRLKSLVIISPCHRPITPTTLESSTVPPPSKLWIFLYSFHESYNPRIFYLWKGQNCTWHCLKSHDFSIDTLLSTPKHLERCGDLRHDESIVFVVSVWTHLLFFITHLHQIWIQVK